MARPRGGDFVSREQVEARESQRSSGSKSRSESGSRTESRNRSRTESWSKSGLDSRSESGSRTRSKADSKQSLNQGDEGQSFLCFGIYLSTHEARRTKLFIQGESVFIQDENEKFSSWMNSFHPG